MALPENFSPWEHLQSVLLSYQNRVVNREFQDAVKDGAATDPNLSIPRHNLYVASKLLDTDTATMTCLRMILFYFVLRKAQDLSPVIYGIPDTTFQDSFVYKPQLKLYFHQDYAEARREGMSPVTGEINIRLRNETSETLTKAELVNLGNKVKSLFANGPLFSWHKGSTLYSYVDKQKGYNLQILAISESEAIEVISKVLQIQNDSFELENMTTHDPKRNFPVVPGTQTIMGKQYRKPRRRPTEIVKFRYAAVYIHGLPGAVTVLDTTGTRRNPLVKTY